MKRQLLTVVAIALGLLGTVAHGEGVPAGAEEAGGYYEYRNWQIEADADKYKQTEHVRLVILNARGDRYNGFSVVQDKWHRVSDLKIRVYDSNGKLAYERKMKDMTKACGFGESFALYRDICTYYIELPGPGYPYTIEYQYQDEISSLFFLDGVAFQSHLPVVSTVLDMRWSAGCDLHHRVYDMDVTPTVTPHGGEVLYHWEATDLPPVNDDDRVPSQYQMPGRIEFSADRFELEGYKFDNWSWNGVGRWYNEVAADRYLPGSSAGASSSTDPVAAMRDAYKRVIDGTRYVAVAIGLGGWQPHEAESVAEKGYGDCKDLSTLLISYLREAGVKAYPALVLTRGMGVIDRDFPMFRFNHVITAAETGADTVWMDPTCTNCPFGLLPTADQDIDVLLMNDSGGAVVRTPATTADDNAVVRTTHIRIQPDRTYRAESAWRTTGNRALYYRSVFAHADREEQRQMVLSLLPNDGRGARMIDYGLAPDDTDDGSATLVVHYETTAPMDEIKGTWYLRPDLFGEGYGLMTIDLADRTVPINLGYPNTTTDSILVTWSGCPIDSVDAPAGDSASCDVLSCRRTVAVYPDSVKLAIQRRYGAYEVPVAAFDQLAAFRDEYGGFRNDVMKFRTSASKGK